MNWNLLESSSPSNSKNAEKKLLMESPWEVHPRDHENKTGCNTDKVAFMEEVWLVVQSYGTQSILKTSLNRPLMREVLNKLDECEGRLTKVR